MPLRLPAPLARLRASLGYRFYLFRRSLSYDLVQTADVRASVALFGHARIAENLIRDYLGSSDPATVTTVLRWPTTGRATHLARTHGLVVFKGGYVPPSLRSRLLHLPAYIGTVRELTGTSEQARGSLATRLRNTLKNIEKKGFRTEISRDPAMLPEFHARYYRPSMLGRHGENAYIAPLGHFEKIMRRETGELHRVFDGGCCIAAMFASISPQGYRIEQFGWRDGDARIVETGALKLLYWQAITRAIELGLPRLHFGGTPACLKNGIFYQKSQWGAHLAQTDDRYEKWSLLLDPAHPGVRAFLGRCSLIFHGPNGGFYVLSGREPSAVPTFASQAPHIATWYRLRKTPATPPLPASACPDLPKHLRPWFDSVPIGA